MPLKDQSTERQDDAFHLLLSAFQSTLQPGLECSASGVRGRSRGSCFCPRWADGLGQPRLSRPPPRLRIPRIGLSTISDPLDHAAGGNPPGRFKVFDVIGRLIRWSGLCKPHLMNALQAEIPDVTRQRGLRGINPLVLQKSSQLFLAAAARP